MTSTFHYRSPYAPTFDVDLGQVVAIALYGPGSGGAGPTDALVGIQQSAAAGNVATSNILLDDPTSSVGHSGDGIVGLRQFYWKEDACPAAVTLTGTVTKTSGTPTLVGSGTLFLTEAIPGRIVKVPGGGGNDYLTITSVADNTHLTVEKAPTHSASGQTAVLQAAQIVYFGYIGRRGYKRSREQTGVLPLARRIAVEIDDANAVLNFRLITGSDGNRPAETIGQRISWLLNSTYFTNLIQDFGLVQYPGHAMDACDYRGQTALSVVQDCALPISYSFFVRYDEARDQFGLAFYDPDGPLDNSHITLSNFGDGDNTSIFETHDDAELTRDPNRIYAGVWLPYAGGTVYSYSSVIAGAYGYRDGSAPNSNVKTAAKALRIAQRFQAQNNEEDDRVTVTVTMDRKDWTRCRPGQLLQGRWSHLAPYDVLTSYRVVNMTIGLAEPNDVRADVAFELTPVRAALACLFPDYVQGTTPSFVQQISSPVVDFGGGTGTPIVLTLPSAPTPGNFLVLTAMPQQSGHAPPDPVIWTLPACWTIDVIGDPDGSADTRLQSVLTAHHVVLSGDPATVTVDISGNASPHWAGYFTLAEYAGMGSAPTVSSAQIGSYQSALGTAVIPNTVIDGTVPGLVVANIAHEPDYHPLSSISAGWAIRAENASSGGSRQATAHADYIHGVTFGTIGGTVTSPGGADDFWWITTVAYAVTP